MTKPELAKQGFVFLQNVAGLDSKQRQELWERNGDEMIIFDPKVKEIVWYDDTEIRYQNEKTQ